MEYEGLFDVRSEAGIWKQLDHLRQNQLMGEAQFLSFLRERGIPALGVFDGELGEFVRRMWLGCDNRAEDATTLFHPFRMFPVHRILDRCKVNIVITASLHPERYLRQAEKWLGRIPSDEEFVRLGREWNRVVDLAVLLEPIYWPGITGIRRWSGDFSEEEARRSHETFRTQALDFLQTLDSKQWRRVHECLVIDASRLDGNEDLYVLLRVAPWERRQRLKERLSGSLWIRHMAEVIRRGFEDATRERWREEHHRVGTRLISGSRILGSERPLDDAITTKRFIAHRFGLFTGSAVRWYVEGDTEYAAFLELFPDMADFGIEIVNLKGEIAARKGNIAIKLEDLLREDRRLQRFSMISLDGDVTENRRFLRRQILEDNLVGRVVLHKPDFEFANFSLQELIEVAAQMDESVGFPGAPVRGADYTSVNGANDFEARYRAASARPQSNLKGKTWGRALGTYASENPKTERGSERPIISQLRAAVFAWSISYTLHYESYTLRS